MSKHTRLHPLAPIVIAAAIVGVSTAWVGAQADIQSAVNAAYAKYQHLAEGKNADYIPALARVDPQLFGIAVVTPDGSVYTAGDVKTEVSIQSISKVFTMARVIQDEDAVWQKIITTYSDFAGRPLSVLQDVYKSESDTNQRNQAIGMLMYAYGYIKANPAQAPDLYTRQCSVGVNAKDLATAERAQKAIADISAALNGNPYGARAERAVATSGRR